MCVCVCVERSSVKPFSLFAHGGAQGRVENEGGADEAESKAAGSARDVMLFVVVLSLCTHSTSRNGRKRRKKRNMNVIQIYPFFGRVGGLCYRWQPEFLYSRHFVCVTGTPFFFFFLFSFYDYYFFFLFYYCRCQLGYRWRDVCTHTHKTWRDTPTCVTNTYTHKRWEGGFHRPASIIRTHTHFSLC
jgi:hypothetical protein